MLTFGHGRATTVELSALVLDAGVGRVVDVRRFPGSRTNPAAARGAVPELLETLGIGYRWDERLGGRRALTPAERATSPDTWWRVEAFRAYAAWTRSECFREALPELVAAPPDTALMCSEALWWRCHRRLISDVLVLEFGRPVRHVLPSGRLVQHIPSAGARRDRYGWLVWAGAAPAATVAGER